MYIRVIFLCFISKLICGDDIAQRLIDRYNDLSMECLDKNNNTRPAFECSGLMVRALADIGGERKYAWSKKESNIRLNKFSTTYLRRDQPFLRLPHGHFSGFIYYPHLKTPRGKNTYRPYCAFPVDAWTDYREGEHGCGKYYKDIFGGSGYCNTVGITSLRKWTDYFKRVMVGQKDDFKFGKHQCSFDMTNRKEAARNFAQVIEIKKYLRHASRKYSMYHNEIVLRAWSESHPKKLPIEAFFYIMDSAKGKIEALSYQNEYLKQTGEKIPVVGFRLPTANDSNLIIVEA